MSVEFKRKKNENFENFLRRFNKSLIKSRRLKEVRRRKYLIPKENKSKIKDKALNGMKIRGKYEYLKKIGKIKEEVRKKW